MLFTTTTLNLYTGSYRSKVRQSVGKLLFRICCDTDYSMVKADNLLWTYAFSGQIDRHKLYASSMDIGFHCAGRLPFCGNISSPI